MTNSVNLDQLEERPVLVVDYGAQYAQLIAVACVKPASTPKSSPTP